MHSQTGPTRATDLQIQKLNHLFREKACFGSPAGEAGTFSGEVGTVTGEARPVSGGARDVSSGG